MCLLPPKGGKGGGFVILNFSQNPITTTKVQRLNYVYSTLVPGLVLRLHSPLREKWVWQIILGSAEVSSYRLPSDRNLGLSS
jgi:hypothetical protein